MLDFLDSYFDVSSRANVLHVNLMRADTVLDLVEIEGLSKLSHTIEATSYMRKRVDSNLPRSILLNEVVINAHLTHLNAVSFGVPVENQIRGSFATQKTNIVISSFVIDGFNIRYEGSELDPLLDLGPIQDVYESNLRNPATSTLVGQLATFDDEWSNKINGNETGPFFELLAEEMEILAQGGGQ